MIIYRGIKSIRKIKGSVATIGVFDGVHKGHRAVINNVVRRASRLGVKSVVITFDPHPAKVLKKGGGAPSLISLDHRINLIRELGVDILVILSFTRNLARYSPERFFNRVLVDLLGVKEVYVGDNFFFGRGASAGAGRLRSIAGSSSVKIEVVRPVMVGDRVASSSLVRKLILSGQLDSAGKVLGRPVSILGTVVRGRKLARSLGYPTANINPHHEVIPPRGVYAVKVRYGNRYLGGVLNIGWKPTFFGPRDMEPTVEVHIFGFRRKIYGKDLEIVFVRKVRDEVRFRDGSDLARQIGRDISASKGILKMLYKSGRL